MIGASRDDRSLRRFKQSGQSGPTLSALSIFFLRSRPARLLPFTGKKLRAKMDAPAAASDISAPHDLQFVMASATHDRPRWFDCFAHVLFFKIYVAHTARAKLFSPPVRFLQEISPVARAGRFSM